MDLEHSDQLLVGSVPFASAKSVFTACCDSIGGNLHSLPDGETGDRIWWHNYLARYVYSGHPDIETLKRPKPVDGYPSWKPKNLDDMWLFRLPPEVEAVKFDELGYAKHAIQSYEVLCLLKELGRVPENIKFQLNLPLTGSAVDVFFHSEKDVERVSTAYEDAAIREISQVLGAIPENDLVVLFDVCIEILEMEGKIPWIVQETALLRTNATVREVSSGIPAAVEVGYHLCYGTLPKWPMTELETIRTQVALANGLVDNSGRRTDFIHLVLPKKPHDAFFDGVEELRVGDTGIYLGLIHEDDTLEDNLARVRLAEQYFPSFGTSYVCGFGRRSVDATNKLLNRHAELAQELKKG